MAYTATVDAGMQLQFGHGHGIEPWMNPSAVRGHGERR